MELYTYIGMTPAGCEWRVWRKTGETEPQHQARVSATTERLAALWAARKAL
jgi:hypothetical protein